MDIKIKLSQNQLGLLELYSNTRISSNEDAQKAFQIILKCILGGN